MSVWDETVLQRHIRDSVEESLSLDYKASGSLEKTDGKKKEITKDISAMANSAGGIIIYGMTEFSGPNNHIPEKIDPVDRTSFSKEWLEHVINNIRPRIEGIVIHSVNLASDPNDVAYVVEIPQSETAHQALDHRYYKRFNFESVPMADHEIRDVMHREVSAPALHGLQDELRFNLEVASHSAGQEVGCHFLDEQFRRLIHLGVISGLAEGLKQSINKAYMTIGQANHVLQAWAAASGPNGRVSMQQEVMRTIRETRAVISAALRELEQTLDE